MRAIDVQQGQHVHGRNVDGQVIEIVRGVGIGTVTWWLDSGRVVVMQAATRVEVW